MTIRNLAHEALRTATADCHRRVDQIYSTARLSDRLAYGNFLRAQAAACLPLEASLERAGVAGVVEDWPERVRGPLILADLAELEIEKPALAEAPAMTSAPAMLGALYVLEGSRLGAKLLKRSVPANFPAAFLAGTRSLSWRSFLARIDHHLGTSERRAEAIDAARRVFSVFEESGRRFL